MNMKAIALSILAGVFASIAVIANDTPDRFQRGQERRGEPVITDTFIGQEWRCGSEMCFAGLATQDGITFLHTGP